MKQLMGIVAAGLFALALIGGTASSAMAGDLPDSTIYSKLMAMLGGHNQAFKGVDACVKNGSVNMHGSVASEELKNQAGDFAKAISSVKEVINNITVK